MPVTKTAKRALRGSKVKESVNKAITSRLEAAIRIAKKDRTIVKITKAISFADRAAKKKVIHKNRAARIKSQMAKLVSKKVVKQKSPKISKKKR